MTQPIFPFASATGSLTHNSYSPDGLLSLPNMIPAGSLGIGEGLADDFLKVGVHGGMRAQPAAKEKPRAK